MTSNKNKGYVFQQSGFTLIELLVVVSIISFLASVIIASVNYAQSRARNALRLENINTIVNGINISLSNSGSLPTTPNWVCISATCYDVYSGYGAYAPLDTFLASGLPTKIKDPNGGNRVAGGFLYDNPVTPPGLPTGAYLDYRLEIPASCGKGVQDGSTSTDIECVLKVD